MPTCFSLLPFALRVCLLALVLARLAVFLPALLVLGLLCALAGLALALLCMLLQQALLPVALIVLGHGSKQLSRYRCTLTRSSTGPRASQGRHGGPSSWQQAGGACLTLLGCVCPATGVPRLPGAKAVE